MAIFTAPSSPLVPAAAFIVPALASPGELSPAAPALLLPHAAAAHSDYLRSPSAVSAAAEPANAGAIAAMPRNSEELKVYWGRLLFASVFLLVILIGGFLAAVLKLEAWSTLLLHRLNCYWVFSLAC
jgi:hypothetical protein